MSNSYADRSWQEWSPVVAVALGAFVVIMTEFLPVGLIDLVGRQFHVNTGTAGLMITVPGIVAAFAAPMATLLAGRVDRRLILCACLMCVALSNTVVALANSFAFVLLGRVLLGMAVGGFWSFAVAVGRRVVPESAGHRATAVILAGVSVGTVVGVPLGSTLGALAGWRMAFGCTAVLALAAVAVQWFLLPGLPGTQITSLLSLPSLFRIRLLRIGYVAIALTAAGQFAAYTYLQPLLSDRAHFGASGLSWALGAYGAAGAAGTFLGERAAAKDLRKTFLFVAMLMGTSILAAAILGTHDAALVTFVILWGGAFGAIPVCTQLWTHMAAPDQFEAASAVGMTIFQGAVAAGSFFGGFLFNNRGLTSAFAFGGCLSIACVLPVLGSKS